jgi:UDP-N-acetylglucosamine 4,6-dehydratase
MQHKTFDDLFCLGRNREVFSEDIFKVECKLKSLISNSKILVIGGAGSIGSAVVHAIFARNPATLHIIDLNENGLTGLVRDLRIKFENSISDLRIFPIDVASAEFAALIENVHPYDYILNFSALKHVRSEGDPYSIMRMLRVNILNNKLLLNTAKMMKVKNFFCVSSDKAVEPSSIMGASKSVMEVLLSDQRNGVKTSSARFANVAFSSGSLLEGFRQRFELHQPLVGPSDIRRFFITHREAGILCVLSTFLGEHGEILFPNAREEIKLQKFPEIAERFLIQQGYKPHFCNSEAEIRKFSKELILNEKTWPCFFSPSKTTGEKQEETFYNNNDEVFLDKYAEIGVAKRKKPVNEESLDYFLTSIHHILNSQSWNKFDLIELLKEVVPDFNHNELNKNLSESI